MENYEWDCVSIHKVATGYLFNNDRPKYKGTKSTGFFFPFKAEIFDSQWTGKIAT